MKVIPIFLMVGLISACSGSNSNRVTGDEYEYMETPTANQIADLIDDDRDGVINARDLCPGTPEGSLIDNDGCGEYAKSSQEMQIRVLFANDSSEINPVFAQQISDLSDFLKEYPTTSIELQGYTSITGTDEYNLALSKRRAESVRKELIKNGISPDRLRIVGFGETKLAAQGTDERSHALNRRVTATVVGYKGEVEKEWTIFTTLPKN
ncbi:OmpA family protein [Vibrio harveyi]|nr:MULTISPECIES: OmpA family protein [Vibrio]EKO3783148.1 OmpA family protein [Vibrio harveyi]EKO3822732.1 OmpA family protein [Vibrio harveyi]MCG9235763.1 OmpA family protein [Vibrio harveyi]MCG9586032.1 OmpA family protein [Vibrio harveyi]CAH1206619.1 OmpA family protein [Vibrio harveyi]